VQAPTTAGIAVLTVVLLCWSAVGLVSWRAVLKKRWTTLAYVLGCWGCALALAFLNSEFTFVGFSLVLQAFILLPLGWSLAALGAFLLMGFFAALTPTTVPDSTDALAGTFVVAGIGTLMAALVFAIWRANHETRLREALIVRLEAAQLDLAERERDAGVMAERARLSRDLHDTLAQGFVGVIAQLSAAELALTHPERKARGHLTTAREIARASLNDIRQLVWALRPPELTDGGVDSALARLTTSWSRQTGLTASFDVTQPFQALVPEVEVALLRVLQEALSNTARHSRARKVEVRLTLEGEFVMLDVTDDGVGFDADADTFGFGLAGMRERLTALGGQLLLESNPGEGTTVTAALPLARAARQEVAA
jgi:signal transduction histidine kinase